MSFFEPEPPPPPPPEHVWGPPLWDRPSEGVLPTVLAVNALLHTGDDVAVALQSLSVYPNGFLVNFTSLSNPRSTPEWGGGIGFVGRLGRPDLMSRMPRVGVRFADGRTGGREVASMELEKDADGIPTQPFVRFSGGGGGSRGYSYSVWVFPLPPDGPLEVFVSVPGLGIDEVSVTIDGSSVRRAAATAQTLWS